jgi:hypothetical protein
MIFCLLKLIDGDEIPSDKAVGDVKQYGLKGLEIEKIKAQASGLLSPTDWYVIKATEVADYMYLVMLQLIEQM